ncbi:endonuclease domain-containing protein [Sphingorhabdus sp.]|uniref:endonuclease domain-containing protein n=1 Tax=Sphingorhabdus sp. TaxID=1902408 RepID=UPI00391A8EAE
MRSRELRRSASPAERLLWSKLCRSQLNGYKFTRQFQIGAYYADIICRSEYLVIEVDGASHEVRQDYDTRRDEFMTLLGYRILRFTNDDVLKNLEGVVSVIAHALEDSPSPDPSRKREGS